MRDLNVNGRSLSGFVGKATDFKFVQVFETSPPCAVFAGAALCAFHELLFVQQTSPNSNKDAETVSLVSIAGPNHEPDETTKNLSHVLKHCPSV